MKLSPRLATLALPLLVASSTPASTISDHLTRFRSNPRQAMDAPLPRWDQNGNLIAPDTEGELRFSKKAIQSGEALTERTRARIKIATSGRRIGDQAEFRESDLAETVADNGATGLLHNLEEMDRQSLFEAELAVKPWSDAHWGYYLGIIGARYADPQFPWNHWYWNHQYVLENPASQIAQSGTDAQVDVLAPSEKYELLIGDAGHTLTAALWERGERAYKETGDVETWKGICHGWAAAALMHPRPLKKITLPTADGKRNLNFYPSDLKALSSLLWAEGKYEMRYTGGRCEKTRPKKDRNGRIIDADCFDTNPGTWHLAIVNQLGVSKRGLILDSSYDYEVWNQPVQSYSYRYFNPRSMEDVDSLEDAITRIGFWGDPFRRYRSSNATSVVGIVMDVTYLKSRYATHADTDSPRDDELRTVQYTYDLELDASGNIIGGEWYTNHHPDFIWVPAPNSRSRSDHEDEALETWMPDHPLPTTWKAAAHNAAPKLQPLSKIVEALLDHAQHRD